jgi:hypothetical protein
MILSEFATPFSIALMAPWFESHDIPISSICRMITLEPFGYPNFSAYVVSCPKEEANPRNISKQKPIILTLIIIVRVNLKVVLFAATLVPENAKVKDRG